MTKPLTVQRLRELIDYLREEREEIVDTLKYALLGEVELGRYADLSIAASSLGTAISTLEFQLRELENGGALDEESIV